MTKRPSVSSILRDRPVAFHPYLVKVTGSVRAALFLSQLLYWQGKGSDPEGWIYKTAQEFTEETGLTRREQDGAREKLKALGILQERRSVANGPLHYLLHAEVFEALVEAEHEESDAPNVQPNDDFDAPNVQPKRHPMHRNATGDAPNVQPDAPKRHLDAPKRHSQYRDYTEITTEITTEIKDENYSENNSSTDPWIPILEEVKRNIPKTHFDAWLKRSRFLRLAENNTIVVAVPTEEQRHYIQLRLAFVIGRIAIRTGVECVMFEAHPP